MGHLATPTPRSAAKVLLKMLPLAIVIGGVTAASAASLGLSPASFGSASASVSSCDTSFSVAYTTVYDEVSGKYQVTHAVVGDIDDVACAGQTLDVVVAGDDYVSLATGSAVEMTLHLVDGVATATVRPLHSVTPSIVVQATLTASHSSELVGNTGYGVISHSTTNVALQAVRVEFPA